MILLKTFFTFLITFISFQVCFARREVDIYAGKIKQIPILISKFATLSDKDSQVAQELQETITNNLSTVIYISAKKIDDTISRDVLAGDTTVSADIEEKGFEYFVVGKLQKDTVNSNQYQIIVSVFDVTSSNPIISKKYDATPKGLKRAGHFISNAIVESVIGYNPFFESKIVYISDSKKINKEQNHKIAIINQDGTEQSYLTEPSLIMTPSYNEQENAIIFSSFVGGKGRIKALDVKNAKVYDLSQKIPFLSGKNAISPVISSDNSKAAFAIHEGSNYNIYVVEINSQKIYKVTNSGINVAPSFSPDGQMIAYTSDATGKQTIYIANYDGSEKRKIAFDAGTYNEPMWSPDGKEILFTKIKSNLFHIGTINLMQNYSEKVLHSAFLAENPAWSKSGHEIAFSTKDRWQKKSQIKIISSYNGKLLRSIKTEESATEPCYVLV